MAEARVRDEWNRTASLMALLANVNRDPRKHGPYKAPDFHPLERKAERAPIGEASISLLKTVFVDRRVAGDINAVAQQ